MKLRPMGEPKVRLWDRFVNFFKPSAPVPAEEPEVVEEMEEVRARDDKGKYVGDDPSTEANETYVTKPAKRKKGKARRRK